MTRFWCHLCNSFVHVNEGAMTCVTCGGEFIEAVQDEEEAHEEQQREERREGRRDEQQNANAGGFPPQGGFYDFQAGPFGNAQPHPFGNIFQMLGQALRGDPMTRQNTAGPMPAAGPFMNPFGIFPPGEFQAGQPQQQGQAAGGPQQGPHVHQAFVQMPFGQVFNFSANGSTLQDLLGPLLGGGQFGDYVSDAGMASLMDRLFRQHQGSQRPVAKNFLDSLPVVKFTKETATGECAICKCDWTEGDEGVDLPCHHLFHKDCIKTWFEKNNLCPMCRHEMPTDDPEYETQRKARQEEKLRSSQGASSSATATATTTNTTTNNRQAQSDDINMTRRQQDLLDEVIVVSSDDDEDYQLAVDHDDEDESSMEVDEEESDEEPHNSRSHSNNKSTSFAPFDLD